jgi:hypothetical protein
MILKKNFTPFRDTIFENETKQVDNVNFHNFTLSFNGFFLYFNVNIKLQYIRSCNFLYGNLVDGSNTSCVATQGYHGGMNMD